MRKFAIVTLVAGLIAVPAAAHDYKLGTLEIDHPWSRATTAGVANGAAFMKIVSHGEADKLISAATPAAAKAELHTHINDNGVMKMREVPSIDVAAGKSVDLKPGGYHVMLLGLKEPLKEGAKVPLTLTFEKAGSVTVEIQVGKPGEMQGVHDATHAH